MSTNARLSSDVAGAILLSAEENELPESVQDADNEDVFTYEISWEV